MTPHAAMLSLPDVRERAMEQPDGLGERGSALWRSLATGREFDAAGAVLLHEACRIADRLERLDALLSGDVEAWCRIARDNGDLTLMVDRALAEGRAQQVALAGLVKQLGFGLSKSTEKGGSALDALAARRAARRPAASGR